MAFTAEQQFALTQLRDNKNFAVLGCAGSGKTVLCNKIRKLLPNLYLSFCGASLNNKPQNTLSWLLKSKHLETAVKCPSFTVILFQANLLNEADIIQIDRQCRRVLKQNKPFGGARVIIFGDFFQVKPVHPLVGFFNLQQIRRLKLTICHLSKDFCRADSPPLQLLLNDCRNFGLSPDSEVLLLYTLNHKSFDKEAVHIFSSERLAQTYNRTRLDAVQEPAINKFKVGVPVRLKKQTLPPNVIQAGTLGTIKAINARAVTVQFEQNIMRFVWPAPLELAFALSVRKASGQKFNKVVVHGTNMFAPGQLYTALSRAKSISGLTCRNVEAGHASILHDPETLRFIRCHQN